MPDEHSSVREAPPVRRALVLMTISSVFVPAAGILTQPILARGLGVVGRGELTAALAPALLVVAVATVGLPDALTYYLAKNPSRTRVALAGATAMSALVGGICLALVWLALPFLSANDRHLGNLILLAMAMSVPTLMVGAFRGAASGRQMWNAVATERVASAVLRIVVLLAFFLAGRLSALLASCLCSAIAGVAYWRLLGRPPRERPGEIARGRVLRLLFVFGNKVWFGSIASMLLSRVGQLLMVPLANVTDLGLYSVATTVSDVPLVVALGIAGALFGVNSAEPDAAKLTFASRLTLFVSFVGSAAISVTVPFAIVPLFGSEFADAVIPTLMLLASAVLCVPSLMAATALGAWGRPGLRAIGLVVTLVFNVVTFVLLVAPFGVIGACWTSVLSNIVMSTFMTIAAARVMAVRPSDFLVVRHADVLFARGEVISIVARLTRRGHRTPC